MYKTALLELIDALSKMQPLLSTGLCRRIHLDTSVSPAAKDVFRVIFIEIVKTWPEYSGDQTYPIKAQSDQTHLTDQTLSMAFAFPSPLYIEARNRLRLHLIDKLTNWDKPHVRY